MMNLFKNLFANPAHSLKSAVSRGAIVIDVRTPEEYREGHIETSKNIPLDKVKDSLPLLRSYHKPVIAVCRSGARSETAVKLLSGAGIEAYNGGAWTSLEKMLA